MKQVSSRGVTLIEMIIYIALFSLLLSGTVAAAYQLIAGSERAKTKILLEEEADFLLRKIDWALTGIQTIYEPIPGLPGAKLVITKLGLPASESRLIIDLDGDVMRLQRCDSAGLNCNSPTPISGSGVSVSDLNFENQQFGATYLPGVKASFELNGRAYETTKHLRR